MKYKITGIYRGKKIVSIHNSKEEAIKIFNKAKVMDKKIVGNKLFRGISRVRNLKLKKAN